MAGQRTQASAPSGRNGAEHAEKPHGLAGEQRPAAHEHHEEDAHDPGGGLLMLRRGVGATSFSATIGPILMRDAARAHLAGQEPVATLA
jgi:hypothetical protein